MYFGRVELSNTQSIQVIELEDGSIGIQKFWRRNSEDDWKRSKGFYLAPLVFLRLFKEMERAVEMLEKRRD